ncbi:MAG: hypothetical protein IT555_00355 [Acetobacteraceae bacterium]|nr:hypothetical protein [Acetobacteraceae bacterium]
MRQVIAEHAQRCVGHLGRITIGRLRRDAHGIHETMVTLITPTEIVTYAAWAADGAVGMTETARRTLPELPLLG